MTRHSNSQHRIGRERLRAVLRDRMGLDPDTVGAHFLDSILDACTHESGLASAADFVAALDTRADLWPLLVRHASVGETWFLRDRAPFLFFAEQVSRLWKGAEPLRVLSYPCASGEEPYSMRIALAEAGIPLDACTIDGCDISQPALAQARAGIYSARSFRGCDPAIQSNYFTPAADSNWKILPAIAQGVRFQQANFLDPACSSLAGPYDIVFCRNLLIYLCPEARLQLLDFLAKRMQPHAVLIVGHAESGLARQSGFIGHGDPAAFAFQKKQKNSAGAPGPSHLGTGDLSSTKSGCPVQAPLGRETTTLNHSPNQALTLDAIRTIADKGDMDDAARACIHYLELHPAAADCHHLLASIHSARGDHDLAESAFRKTLYLDPENTEARLHLTLLSSRKRQNQPAHAVAHRRRTP